MPSIHTLYTAPSAISGLGLFAKQHFKPEEIILRLKGDHIFHDYTPKFAKEGANWIGIGPNEWLVPPKGHPILFLNHSCSPNVFINSHLELITASYLPANTELLLDYSTTELDPFWSMDCSCSSCDCRKVIANFNSLSPALRVKYSYFIHPAFWKKSIESLFN